MAVYVISRYLPEIDTFIMLVMQKISNFYYIELMQQK